MSRVQQQGGAGGRVTVEGLSPEKVRAGAAVTVKRGSKVVEQVAGSYTGPSQEILVGSWTPEIADSYGTGASVHSRSFDVKAKLPDLYPQLTAKNFVVKSNGVSWGRAYGSTYGRCALLFPVISNYDPNTGIVTVANTTTDYSVQGVGFVSCYGIDVYAVI